jgi:tRNA uridine 5-carbamoylmethylation protein Kti12
MKPQLVILRGLPGAGKSTFAKNYANVLAASGQVVKGPFEADNFFINKTTGAYEFNPELLGAAHTQCMKDVELVMLQQATHVIVSNTATTERELKPYLALAKKYGYDVVSLVVENRHGNDSVHNVPEEAMTKMEARFSVKLRPTDV